MIYISRGGLYTIYYIYTTILYSTISYYYTILYNTIHLVWRGPDRYIVQILIVELFNLEL